MDGYAVRAADAAPGARLRVIGEAARRRAASPARVGPGEAVRIFTGAPVPDGADAVVIQEDVDARRTTRITVRAGPRRRAHIRPAGGDFAAGAAHRRAAPPLAAPTSPSSPR